MQLAPAGAAGREADGAAPPGEKGERMRGGEAGNVRPPGHTTLALLPRGTAGGHDSERLCPRPPALPGRHPVDPERGALRGPRRSDTAAAAAPGTGRGLDRGRGHLLPEGQLILM